MLANDQSRVDANLERPAVSGYDEVLPMDEVVSFSKRIVGANGCFLSNYDFDARHSILRIIELEIRSIMPCR